MTEQELRKQLEFLDKPHIKEQVDQFVDKLYNNLDLIYLRDFKVKSDLNRIHIIWESNDYCYVYIDIFNFEEGTIQFCLYINSKSGDNSIGGYDYLDLLKDEDWEVVDKYLTRYSKFNNLNIKTMDEEVISLLAEEYLEDYIHYNEELLQGFKAGAKRVLDIYNKSNNI